MKNIKKLSRVSFVMGAIVTSGAVFAHSAFVLNPVNGKREFQENSTHYLKLSLNHTCADADGVYQDIHHAGVLLPNNNATITEYNITDSGAPDTEGESSQLSDLSGVLATFDREGNAHGANSLMSIKPVLDANWGLISINKGEVGAFYNHGERTEDLRAIYYMNARNPLDPNKVGLPNDYVTSLEFKANVGTLQGCAAKVRVYTPSADYCAGGYVKVWTGENTETLSAELKESSNNRIDISTGYTPYFDIVRSESNPLDESCGAGKVVTVMASDHDIDEYLAKFAPMWGGVEHGNDSHDHNAHDHGDSDSETQQCPEGQHFMPDTGECMDNNAMM